jgi:DNA-binding winged helix-turn-helix (wHTH) protein
MELLIFSVGRRDQLVSRREIVAKLWRSDLLIDTERNINNLVRKLRTALHGDSAEPRFLETAVGKGYRFIGSVRIIDTVIPTLISQMQRRCREGAPRRGTIIAPSLCSLSFFLVMPPTSVAFALDSRTRWFRTLAICRV